MRRSAAQQKAAAAMRLLAVHGAPHRGLLNAGLLATVFVVLCRLAMPWPLRGVLEIASGRPPVLGGEGSWVTQTLWMGAIYVVIATILGYVEMRQRVSLKEFATHTVHDLRDAAVASLENATTKKPLSDLLSRIIGDTARVKAELSGILVHVSQNGLLFLAVCALFAVLSPKLSLFFLLGGMFAVFVGYRATKPIGEVTKLQREREAQYARHVQEVLSGDPGEEDDSELNEGSARADINATRLIALSAWIVHIGLAVITGVALLVAVNEVKQGRIQLGDVFLFIAYVLTVHRRMIQVGRQLARSGKLVANVARVGELLDSGPKEPPPRQLPVLVRSLELAEVSAVDRRSQSRRVRLQPVSITIRRGAKVALVGDTGSGKSTLLQLFAGAENHDGTIIWDRRRVSAEELQTATDLAYIPQVPVFGARKLQRFIPDEPRLESDIARALGVYRLVKASRQKLKSQVSSRTLTRHEAQSLLLAELFWNSSATVWLIDDPVSGLPERSAKRLLRAILTEAAGRTVIIALPAPVLRTRFNRLIVLRNGRIEYDADPTGWPVVQKERVPQLS
jgi:ATP-binding cassette, subfamily C, bacterial CydC